MKISVALATYNGSKYLREQLESFAIQRRLPDELIICDDCSHDETHRIIIQFINEAPFPVLFFRNEINLGYAKNFEQALLYCSGDIILFSDQDDVWSVDKIEKVESIFLNNSDAMLVMHDAEIVLNDGIRTGFTLQGQTKALGLNLERDFGLGCCMAFRRELVELSMPLPFADSLHDVWLNTFAIHLGKKFIISDVLSFYRRHELNSSAWIAGSCNKLTKFDLIYSWFFESSYKSCLRRYKDLVEINMRLNDYLIYNKYSAVNVQFYCTLNSINNEVRAISFRIGVFRSSRVNRFFWALYLFLRGDCYRFFSNWKSFLKDLMCIR